MPAPAAARAAAGLAVLLVGLLSAGCGRQQPAGPAAGPPAAVPAAQRAALADGTVTRAEYQAAYAAFARCVAAGRGRLRETGRDRASGMIEYSTPHRLGTPAAPNRGSVEGRCYNDTFDRVEYVFETTDPAVLAAVAARSRQVYAEHIRPCLVKNHLDAPADPPDPAGPEFATLNSTASQLQQQGRC